MNLNLQFQENIQLFLLRCELVESGIYNHNLHRIIVTLQWRLELEISKLDIMNKRYKTLELNYNNQEEILTMTQSIKQRLESRLHKTEYELEKQIKLEKAAKAQTPQNTNINTEISPNARKPGGIITKKISPSITRIRSLKVNAQGRRLSKRTTPSHLLPEGENFRRISNFNSRSDNLQGTRENKTQSQEAEISFPRDPTFGGCSFENPNNMSYDPNNSHVRTISRSNRGVCDDLTFIQQNDPFLAGGEGSARGLREELELQRGRAEQMKNAYLENKQFINKLHFTIQYNQQSACNLLKNEAFNWQNKLDELKVSYIYIYI